MEEKITCREVEVGSKEKEHLKYKARYTLQVMQEFEGKREQICWLQER